MPNIKAYYELAKPGIIYGNVLTAAAGFFLASTSVIHWFLFLEMLIGLSLVIGAACVFNNYIDRDIDIDMERTKNRATVTGIISPKATLVYGSALLIFGTLVLYFFTNPLTLFVALLGVFFYVVLYTPLKRRSVHSTLVGSIAGATPPVVGFCAVTGIFNVEAFILFLILFFWQMPHFYAIAVYRSDEYAAASVPTLPIKKGSHATKVYILFYISAFAIASVLLTIFNFTRYVYLSAIIILGLIWLWLALNGFRSGVDDKQWGRKVFLFSLVVITIFSLTASFGIRLP